jgi:putative ABC transport system substrate-binding protein
MAELHKGMEQAGVANPSALMDLRWADTDTKKLATDAKELAASGLEVVISAGGTGVAKLLGAETATLNSPPGIVFIEGLDPVAAGLVGSVDAEGRPNGNATGLNTTTTELLPERFKQLHQMVPGAGTIAVLVNSTTMVAVAEPAILQPAANAVGVKLSVVSASPANPDFKQAFQDARSAGAQAMLVTADPFFTTSHAKIVGAAAQLAMPTAYPFREYVDAGGLMSYGPRLKTMYRQIGVYAGLILANKAKASDLPILRPGAVELVINLETANALKLQVPGILLAQADEIIE